MVGTAREGVLEAPRGELGRFGDSLTERQWLTVKALKADSREHGEVWCKESEGRAGNSVRVCAVGI